RGQGGDGIEISLAQKPCQGSPVSLLKNRANLTSSQGQGFPDAARMRVFLTAGEGLCGLANRGHQ
ncbi:MAG: hypothetical protein PF483_05060, partial [Halothiobacillus sp.]|nr:hypothetical protein [Halothiobacillus sp.]